MNANTVKIRAITYNNDSSCETCRLIIIVDYLLRQAKVAIKAIAAAAAARQVVTLILINQLSDLGIETD